MLRALGALREWLELRGRVHEEHQFHLAQAAADYRGLGLSRQEARKKARIRFGSRRNMRIARRELGGDMNGLAYLLRVHRVTASPWFQPGVLVFAILAALLLSPAPREVAEGVLGRTLNRSDRGAVVLSARGPAPLYDGIPAWELRALQSMKTVTAVQRFGMDVQARAAQGAELGAIESEARVKTRNRSFYAVWISDEPAIRTGPAKAIWAFIAIFGAFFLLRNMRQVGTWRWLFYAVGTGVLQALASLTAWAFVVQTCHGSQWSIMVLFVAYLVAAGMQCRCWWSDLQQRCPICLDRLVLPLESGVQDRLLLNPATTECVCAHGHGTLVTSQWSRQFRQQECELQIFGLLIFNARRSV